MVNRVGKISRKTLTPLVQTEAASVSRPSDPSLYKDQLSLVERLGLADNLISLLRSNQYVEQITKIARKTSSFPEFLRLAWCLEQFHNTELDMVQIVTGSILIKKGIYSFDEVAGKLSGDEVQVEHKRIRIADKLEAKRPGTDQLGAYQMAGLSKEDRDQYLSQLKKTNSDEYSEFLERRSDALKRVRRSRWTAWLKELFKDGDPREIASYLNGLPDENIYFAFKVLNDISASSKLAVIEEILSTYYVSENPHLIEAAVRALITLIDNGEATLNEKRLGWVVDGFGAYHGNLYAASMEFIAKYFEQIVIRKTFKQHLNRWGGRLSAYVLSRLMDLDKKPDSVYINADIPRICEACAEAEAFFAHSTANGYYKIINGSFFLKTMMSTENTAIYLGRPMYGLIYGRVYQFSKNSMLAALCSKGRNIRINGLGCRLLRNSGLKKEQLIAMALDMHYNL